jgi:hypothetical protein
LYAALMAALESNILQLYTIAEKDSEFDKVGLWYSLWLLMGRNVVMSGEGLWLQQPESFATVKPSIVELTRLQQVNLDLLIVALDVVIDAVHPRDEWEDDL